MYKKQKNKQIFKTNVSTLSRTEVLEGKEYLVAPAVVAIGNTVMNGIYYPEEELYRSVNHWNGLVAVVYHPSLNGELISANSPMVWEQYKIGFTFNTMFEDNKLKTEFWIDKEKLTNKFPELKSRIDANINIDVSIGLYEKLMYAEGMGMDKKHYYSIASDFQPDHIAILPDEQGALSWSDGGGLFRVNKKTIGENMEKAEIINLITNAKTKEENHVHVINLTENKCIFQINWDKCYESEFSISEDNVSFTNEKEINLFSVNVEQLRDIEQKLSEREDAINERDSKIALIEKELRDNKEAHQMIVDEYNQIKAQIENLEKEPLISDILSVNSGVFTKEELEKKSKEDLIKLNSFAKSVDMIAQKSAEEIKTNRKNDTEIEPL
jgi:hypothetical protein